MGLHLPGHKLPSAERANARHILFFGMLALVLGLMTLIGWHLEIITLASLVPGRQPMVINTAAGFCLVGGVIIYRAFGRTPRSVAATLVVGTLITLLGVSVVLEIVLRKSWLDLNQLHHLRSAFSINPGQMAPNTAFCFILLGLALMLVNQTGKVAATLVRLFLLALTALGIIGISSFVINLEFIYGYSNLNRMALSTAFALVFSASGVLHIHYQTASRFVPRGDVEPAHIYKTSDAVLMALGAIAAIVSFALSQQHTEDLMAQEMSQTAAERREFFTQVLDLKIQGAQLNSDRPVLEQVIRRLKIDPANTEERQSITATAASILRYGFSAVSVESPDKKIIIGRGKFTDHPDLVIPISQDDSIELIWKDGYILRTRVAMHNAMGEIFAYMRSEQPLPMLTNLQANALQHGASGDMMICSLKQDRLICFPTRWSKKPFTISAYLDGQPLPVTRGAMGETTTFVTLDFRNQRVMASFGPVSDTGLGMAIKMDMWELYAPIRKQFLTALPFLILLIGAGVLLMRLRLRPLIEALEESRKQLVVMARHDPLSGLPNRTLFNERLESAIARARRSNKPMALMYLDLDYFKRINDTYGHAVGDEVLRWFSALLIQAVRSTDTVARIGGDEFTIILEELDNEADAEHIAQTLLKTMDESNYILPDDKIPKITASFGIALHYGDATTAEGLLAKADAALYEAKKFGRNVYKFIR